MQTFTKDEGRFERTAPLLKQSQLQEMGQERDRLKQTLHAPPHLRNAIQDASTMFGVLKRLESSLERDTPREYAGAELDKAVRREKELREKIMKGMPTSEEMRRNPPGALDKHMQWEARNKADIGEWKNIRRRMMASGAVESSVSDASVANVEMLRPSGGHQLSMDGAQIPVAKTYYGLGGRSSTFTDEELVLLEKVAPRLKEMIALLSADQRDEIKTSLQAEAVIQLDTSALDGLTHKEARERCRAAGLETGGSREDLVDRLKAHYGKA